MKHILVDDQTARELSEQIADDLVLRGIIVKTAGWNNGEIYGVHKDYDHLQDEDLDALCDGVEVADEILNPPSLHTTRERHTASWIQAARECARAGDLAGVLRCLDAAEEWPA